MLPPRSITRYLAPAGSEAITLPPSLCVQTSTGILRQYIDAASGSRAKDTCASFSPA